jgi:hypothetical protein
MGLINNDREKRGTGSRETAGMCERLSQGEVDTSLRQEKNEIIEGIKAPPFLGTVRGFGIEIEEPRGIRTVNILTQ